MLVSNIGKFMTLNSVHQKFCVVKNKQNFSNTPKTFEADHNKETNLIQKIFLEKSQTTIYNYKLNTLA